ncbi:MAG TPA: hypothetical protein PLS66_04095 [Tepiditoga sp.]|nr:HD domain-containing protein [Thermotogota bacterium]HOO74453.1 hypothetical protein [Tepiditoga sp.]
MESVYDYYKELKKIYNFDNDYAETAIWGHDIFREKDDDFFISQAEKYGIEISYIEKKSPLLLHGKIAAEYLKEKYSVNSEIYEAVYYHTSGYKFDNDTGKIMLICDALERTRDFEGVEYLREKSFKGINIAYKLIVKNKIEYALKKQLFILPETVEAYNNYISKI